MHVVLLGDSILDNASYTGGAPDVCGWLERDLRGHQVTLRAVDGAVMGSIPAQLRGIPPDATHLVLSMGGNNLLGQMGTLNERVETAGQGFGLAASLVEAFEREYAQTLDAVRTRNLPLVVCTIYHPHLPDPTMRRALLAALTLFNDVIIRQAVRGGHPILDLRQVATEPDDFVFNIEPSAQGGKKIANAIAALLHEHDFAVRRTMIYP